MLETIFGIRVAHYGNIEVNGTELTLQSPVTSMAAALALVPEDRKRDGLALGLSIADNLILTNLQNLARFGFLYAKRKREFSPDVIRNLRIKCRNSAQSAKGLSGGNQQKIVLGKWLARKPSVLLLDEPTRGVDLATKSEIHRLLLELSASGMAILLASSDMQSCSPSATGSS